MRGYRSGEHPRFLWRIPNVFAGEPDAIEANRHPARIASLSLKDRFGGSLFDMDISCALKTFYLGTVASILVAYKIPPLNDRFLAYGPRSAARQAGHHAGSIDLKFNGNSARLPSAYGMSFLITLFDFLATLQVPHGWFMSFYCISVASSLLWGYQLLSHETVYRKVASWKQNPAASMPLDRISLCWSLMALQGARRLWECLVLTKPSKSRMWVFHWLAGVLFYIATGISVWIEGVPALESTDQTWRDIHFSAPSLSVVVLLLIFLLASVVQHRIHVHLALLKKYTLPVHPAFSKIVCPHYTAECVLYLSLTGLAAPQGQLVNGTMLCAAVFVIVNLGVTADISKNWAMEKFGREKVERKWRMLPGLW